MKRISKKITGYLLASTLVTACPTMATTLQQAIQTTVNSHPDIRSVVHNRLARDQEVRQACSGYFPTLEISGGIGTDDVNKPFDDTLSPQEIRISLRQNIFAGFSTKNEINRQEARVRSEAYVIQSTAENTALKTSRAYLDVLRYEALLKLAKENLFVHEQISDQIQLRSKSGVGSRTDADQVSSRVRLAQANMVAAEQNLADAKTNYEALVGEAPSDLSDPELPDGLLPDSFEAAKKQALKGHPTLKTATADLEARKMQDRVARSPFMPIIDLEVDQVWEDETNYSYDRREDLRAMVRLRYNLFNGWKDDARKAETLELINEAREIRNHTRRQVIEGLDLSWRAYKAISNRLPYLAQRVEFATATARSYHKQWDIGKRTLLDVLDSEAERIDASMQHVQAKYDALYARCRILNSMGQLVTALKLNYPEEAKAN